MKQQILWVVEMRKLDGEWAVFTTRKTRAEARSFCDGHSGLRVVKYIRSE